MIVYAVQNSAFRIPPAISEVLVIDPQVHWVDRSIFTRVELDAADRLELVLCVGREIEALSGKELPSRKVRRDVEEKSVFSLDSGTEIVVALESNCCSFLPDIPCIRVEYGIPSFITIVRIARVSLRGRHRRAWTRALL